MSIPSTYKNPYEPRRILASELSAPIKRTFTDEICKADPEVRWVQGWKLMIMASGLALATLMVTSLIWDESQFRIVANYWLLRFRLTPQSLVSK